MWMLFAISLVPMVLFVLIDYYTRNLRASIISAILTSIIVGYATYYLMGDVIEVVAIVTTMIITGLISIKMNTPIYFKFQPVITGAVLAAVIAYFQYFDTPIMIKMLPKIIELLEDSKFADPQVLEILHDESRLPFYARLTEHMIFWLLIHAALVAVCALKFRNSIWLLAKAIGPIFVALGTMLTANYLA